MTQRLIPQSLYANNINRLRIYKKTFFRVCNHRNYVQYSSGQDISHRCNVNSRGIEAGKLVTLHYRLIREFENHIIRWV